jgi:hypothetical protein
MSETVAAEALLAAAAQYLEFVYELKVHGLGVFKADFLIARPRAKGLHNSQSRRGSSPRTNSHWRKL